MDLTNLQQPLGPHSQAGTEWLHPPFQQNPNQFHILLFPLRTLSSAPSVTQRETHASSSPKKRLHPRMCSPEYNSLNAWLEGAGSKFFRATCRCTYVLIRKTHAYFCPEAHTGENHQPVYLHYSLNKQKRAGQHPLQKALHQY